MKFYNFYFLLLTFFVTSYSTLYAQIVPVNRNIYKIHIKETNQKPDIDGVLNEEIWKEKRLRFGKKPNSQAGIRIAPATDNPFARLPVR